MPSPRGTSNSVLGAMGSGEWLRTQWIARVAFNLPAVHGPWTPYYAQARAALSALERQGRVERRRVDRREEWRLR